MWFILGEWGIILGEWGVWALFCVGGVYGHYFGLVGVVGGGWRWVHCLIMSILNKHICQNFFQENGILAFL